MIQEHQKTLNRNLQKAREAKKTGNVKAQTAAHEIRGKNGDLCKVRLTRKMAIFCHCTECMGFEDHPSDCTSKHCALFPFRGRTRKAC